MSFGSATPRDIECICRGRDCAERQRFERGLDEAIPAGWNVSPDGNFDLCPNCYRARRSRLISDYNWSMEGK